MHRAQTNINIPSASCRALCSNGYCVSDILSRTSLRTGVFCLWGASSPLALLHVCVCNLILFCPPERYVSIFFFFFSLFRSFSSPGLI